MTMVLGMREAGPVSAQLSLMADTMITRMDRVRNDILPGLLKIITVAEGLSVAFAGDADRARALILAARAGYLQDADIDGFIRRLGRETRDGRCEFLVVATVDTPILVKLFDGRTAKGGNEYRLGDSAPLKRRIDADRRYGTPGLSAAAKSRIAFLDLFNEYGVQLAKTVGGFGVVLDCRPGAHIFMDHAVSIPLDNADAAHIDLDVAEAAGMTQYSAACIASRWPNAPVLGFYMPQIEVGWIYDPLSEPDPVQVRGGGAGDLQAEVERRALAALATFPLGVPKTPVALVTVALTPGQADLLQGPPNALTVTNLSFRRGSRG